MTIISVITPTFRREDLLQRCVESVLAQQVQAEIEHIVVNDAGEPLAHAAWMDDPRVTVLTTYRTERSVARNTGAALSRGDWLHFLDDDDYLLPGAFAALLAIARDSPDTAHIYGGYRIADERLRQCTDIQPMLQGDIFPMLVAGESFPPQATWLRRDAFFRAAGFDPDLVPAEDADLVRRIGYFGPLAGTPFIVAVARVDHPETTTTDYDRHHDFWLLGVEKCLTLPETLVKVLRRTRHSPYWRGRCVRVYLGSGGRNWKGRRYGVAFSRFAASARAGVGHCLSPDFWRGMRRRPGAPLQL